MFVRHAPLARDTLTQFALVSITIDYHTISHWCIVLGTFQLEASLATLRQHEFVIVAGQFNSHLPRFARLLHEYRTFVQRLDMNAHRRSSQYYL